MNNLDKKYTDLLQDILNNGVKKEDRTGTGTLSVFGRQIRHKMSEGFPLLTTKKMYFKGVATELLWFLRGDTNIKYLVDNDCHIWDGDAYKNYIFNSEWFPISSVSGGMIGTKTGSDEIMTQTLFIEKIKTDDWFAKKWGELGKIYGRQWRSWGYEPQTDERGYGIKGIDQITNLINDLKTNPDSRRLMVSAWNVGELDQMTLPPCHYGFQVYTRELSSQERKDIYDKSSYVKDVFPTDENGWNSLFNDCNIPTRAISLMWNQRSVDTFLGLPFNIASYGLLLEIIAKEVNMVPDELIGNLGDTHLYLNHVEQAKEQIGRELSWEERRDLLTEDQRRGRVADKNGIMQGDFGNITPFVEPIINYWLDCHNIPKRTREPFPLPKLFFKYEKETYIDNYELDGFFLKDYQSHPTIKAPLSN
jgi:thymidylate synthase